MATIDLVSVAGAEPPLGSTVIPPTRGVAGGLTPAVITGIMGQDGLYLAELLASKNYIIYGIVRRESINQLDRLTPMLRSYPNLIIKGIDLTDSQLICELFAEIKAQHFNGVVNEKHRARLEIYNFAAQSNVKLSFDNPEFITDINAVGPLRLLEAIRKNDLVSVVRFCQAGTSELFGKAVEVPQSETTSFYPRSPYGVAKLYAHWIVKNYRENYDMYACNSICFNHESPRRTKDFVTRKITHGIAQLIKDPKSMPLELGNIDAQRDWGFAGDYVYGMWLMLQQSTPDDYVLSTGKLHTIREFIETALKIVGIFINWRGNGIDEVGYHSLTGQILVKINPLYYRSYEVGVLVGNYNKAQRLLGWTPTVQFEELVKLMMVHDIE